MSERLDERSNSRQICTAQLIHHGRVHFSFIHSVEWNRSYVSKKARQLEKIS